MYIPTRPKQLYSFHIDPLWIPTLRDAAKASGVTPSVFIEQRLYEVLPLPFKDLDEMDPYDREQYQAQLKKLREKKPWTWKGIFAELFCWGCLLGILFAIGMGVWACYDTATGNIPHPVSYSHLQRLLEKHPEIKTELYDALMDDVVTFAEKRRIDKIVDDKERRELIQGMNK